MNIVQQPGADSREGHVDSYYSATARQLPVFDAFDGDRQADVCVVGAGLAGLTAALELAKAGKEVVLLEQARVGWAASGRNGGFVSGGFAELIFAIEDRLGLDHARALYRLSVEGVGYVRRRILDAGRGDMIGGHGWLKMVRYDDAAGLERRAERMARDYGAAYRFVDRGELAEYVRSRRYHAGILDMSPFHIQPLDYAVLLAGEAAAAGAAIHENSRVLSVERQAMHWRVETRYGVVRAHDVILATSAYGGPSRRINSAVLPVSTYVVTARSSKLDEAILFSGCLGDTRRAGDYYRIVGTGDGRRLLWGGRITTRRSVPRRLGEKLAHDIRNVYPQLDDLRIDQAWAGLMGYAIHKMPIIGRFGEGLWVATAFGGHGLNTTAMGGRLVAAAIAHSDDEWRLFEPFAAEWGGGLIGRVATQLEYWRLQFLDRIEESRASTGRAD